MPPLSLSDQELEIVTRMAEPVAFNMRREYLQAVAEALSQYPQAEIGVGAVHQVARTVQRGFTLHARKEAATGSGETKGYRGPRQAPQSGPPGRGERHAGP
jgi:hypothetical protein